MLASHPPCGFGNSRLTYKNPMKECTVVDLCWGLNGSLEVFQEEGYSPRDVTRTDLLGLAIEKQPQPRKETDPCSQDLPTTLHSTMKSTDQNPSHQSLQTLHE